MISKKFSTLFQFEPKSNIKAGAGLDKGKYPFYTSSTILTKKIDVAQYKGNSIVIGTGGQPSVHYASIPFSTSTHCVVVTPKTKEINPRYVYYFLKNNMHILQKGFRGAGLKNISKSYLDQIEIPVISLEEQNRIVWVLDKTEKLICQRKQSIEALEALIKSVFLEMFGDPVLNPQEYPIISLSQLGKWQSGGTPLRSKEYYYDGNIPWYSSGELNDVHIFQSKENINSRAIRETSAKLVKAGSLLLGMYDTAALKSSITRVDASCNQAIAFSLLSENKCNSLYVYMAIQLGKRMHLSRRRGVRQRNLNLNMIKGIKIPLPPVKDQNRYALIFEKTLDEIDKLKDSLNRLETLFQSLLQKAFRGELVLNNSEYSFQKAVTDLNWFEEQLQTMQPYGFSSEIIKVLAEIRDKEEIETIDDLSEALKENHFPEINEIVDLKELLYSFGVTLLCEVDDQKQIQQLISHPALQHTNIDLAFNKLLKERKLEREKVNQEIIKENDRTLRFMNRTLFQEMLFGDEQVNLAHFIHESFQDKEFTVSGIMERLRAKQALQGKKASEVKNDVFALIQKFIKIEFVDLPFTFQELYRRLREKLFCPSFDLLHEFVVIELDRKPGLLQMYYPGDMANQFPKHFQHLQNEKASNKLYLIATYGNSQD
ncbi:restriction endonuclease subunit S [Odoribacter laneus]|uniref:restriction endonuclease subunit S n=2 Tax=Odoribacter laneus TaxID=626933 RepID=UPI003FEEFF9F